MEFLDGQRVFVSVLLSIIHVPEFEGYQDETTPHAVWKILNSSTGSESFFNDVETDDLRMLQRDIEIQLQTSHAKSFLDGLSNKFQREIVLTNLRLCPFVPLCQFKMNFDSLNYDFFRENSCCFPCSCDKEKCLLTRTCCPDIQMPEHDMSDFEDTRETCVATEIKDVHENVHRIKAISECPMQTDSDLVTKCVNNYENNLRNVEIEDITLVSDSSNNRIYRNKYCAECNFVNTSSYLYWSPRLECFQVPELSMIISSMDLVEQIMDGEVSCYVIFQQPKMNSNIRSCILGCNFTGLWDSYDPDVDKACGLYESAVDVGNSQYFRNVFCARCNGFNFKLSDIRPSYFIPSVDFVGLLRLSESTHDNSDSCGKSKKYDSIQDKCRQAVCSYGRELKNGRCELILDGKVAIDLDIYLLLEPQDPIPLHQAYDIVPEITEAVIEEIDKRVDQQRICSIQVLLQSNIPGNQSIHNNRSSDKWEEVASATNHSVVLFYLFRIQIIGRAQLETNVDSFKNLNGAFIFLYGTEIARQYLEKPLPFFSMKLVHDTNKWKFDKIASELHNFEEKNIENEVMPIDYTALQNDSLLLFNDTDNMLQISFLLWSYEFEYCRHEKPRYALLSLKSCPMFQITWEEFNWKESINGIEIEGTSIRLDADDYTMVTKSRSTYLLICVDAYLKKFKPLERLVRDIDRDPVKIAKIIISLFCICASVICLVFSLVTYCMFKQLRTLPGKNNIALIVSLILAQVFHLIGGTANLDLNGFICKTVGVLTHFFWLVSMFWMNICTFHMCQVLLTIRHVSHIGYCRRYAYYHLYCISMTFIFVVINVGVSMATSGNTDIGYGKIACYVSTQRMVDFTFGVPSMLVVFSNLNMFLAVIISLKKRPSIRQNVKNDRNYFVTFIKLSTVTGITWIFGFLYMWTGIEAFSFLFIILNACQGLFITLAFVCNKRTTTLYKELLRRHDRPLPSTGINRADSPADIVSTHL